MKSQKNVRASAFVTATLVPLLCLALPLLAAPSSEPLAGVDVAAGQVTFLPLISYSQVRVTVTGPEGFEVVKTFGADETPAVELPGTDGLYKYEMRFSPVLGRQARERLAKARENGIDLGADKTATADKRTVQRGSFSLADGGVVPDLVEVEPKVVLTNADGVIRNSLCVGFDCPDAPIFDDSTILLMENNTRIKFGDTSNAPFPNNDWEIEANSSLSGGANYLGFNDCGSADNDGGCATDLVFAVESGARQSALYVESDGDVGIGTSSPVVDVHLVTGNTPTLRLDQDGSSGFAPQVWDIAGNETNFFVRDVTAGSRLPFRIRPGAPTSAVDIAASGNVGIGTASPTTRLHVLLGGTPFGFNASTSMGLQNSAAAGNGVILSLIGGNGAGGNSQLAFGDTDSEFRGRIIYDHGVLDSFRFFTNGALAMTLKNSTQANLVEMANGAFLTQAGVWTDASSREYKQNISPLSSEAAMTALDELVPVTYNYKVSPEETYVGFIAEDVPDLVAAADRKGLAPMDIVAVLTRVAQQQQRLLETQQETIRELSSKLAALEARIDD